MVKIVLGRYYLEVPPNQIISRPLIFEELRIITDVVYTRENLLKIAKPKLFFFEFKHCLQVVFGQTLLVVARKLPHHLPEQ